MKLYIQIENGQPVNHPAIEENLIQAFGSIPDNWIAFERIERPQIGVYDLFDQDYPEYQLVDGIYKDVWLIRPMNELEKTAKQQVVKDSWDSLPNRENFTDWAFDEVTCSYIPPVPYPQDDKYYQWDESIINWVEVNNEQIINR